MARIEDYAVIGNRKTMALVRRDASIDWLCLPRFDSDACFAALLGDQSHGFWQIAPAAEVTNSERHYRDGTLVLDTVFECAQGKVMVSDCMHAANHDRVDLLRVVTGLEGKVPMQLRLCLRFGYGRVIPWVSRTGDGRLQAVAGPDRVVLATPVGLRGEDLNTVADFSVAADEIVPFAMTWVPSWEGLPEPLDAMVLVEHETRVNEGWSGRCRKAGPWTEAVKRSLVTLKALTHRDTGGIVAAATTSLPEQLGGSRNWDYRYCWLRDATLTLLALIAGGYIDEAASWRKWLLRAVAGDPANLRIMYSLAGERRLSEYELPWLPGYESSAPVRVGNAASSQLQLDVYGEVMDALHQGRRHGLSELESGWSLQRTMVEHLESIWQQPDDGIWEIRGPRRHFTHSKVMVWVAFDRMIQSVEEFGLEGPVEHWRELRQQVHEDVCKRGFDNNRGSFVQYYGADGVLDASLLQIPLTGFLPVADERVRGTIDAIEKRLVSHGFVRRYDTACGVDGLTGDEGAFLACSFWLVDCMTMQGRLDEARAMFERLLTLRNDVGLLSEEYDVKAERQVGNFPQAFSHIALVNSAYNLSEALWPDTHKRAGGHRHQ
ncbi:MAG TPA: glycoside hydrolase family 15 protein [Rhodanobacteraceae bacterium]|nr:glycoside hydrolase family 15 protein [Rhodanobacteraceae bacterium]